MGIFKVLLMVTASICAYQLFSYLTHVEFPSLEPDPWWAMGPRRKDNVSINNFKINIPDKDVKDLNTRLNLPIILTAPLEGANFTYGFNSETLKTIVDYWKSKYNWRQREAKLNTLNHYKTQIEGLDIHFIRVTPKVAKNVIVRPLLMIHGWPGSFVEFMDILPILTTPQKGNHVAFEVITPSLPGFGFSDSSTKPGLGVPQTAQIFSKLMKRLGYNKYYVQGGDWGSLVANVMGTLYPEEVIGMHITMVPQNTPLSIFKYICGSVLPSGFVMDKSRESQMYPISDYLRYVVRETGYLHLQSTKPDTVGIALSNSPEGLAAYILEKFSTWTNKNGPNQADGGLLTNFPISLNKLLDNVNIYWFTRTITTSLRYYAEMEEYNKLKIELIPTFTPTGIAAFPHEMYLSPKNFAEEKYKNLITYTTHDIGGHFGAMEIPHVLADDFFNFVYIVEKKNKNTEL